MTFKIWTLTRLWGAAAWGQTPRLWSKSFVIVSQSAEHVDAAGLLVPAVANGIWRILEFATDDGLLIGLWALIRHAFAVVRSTGVLI